MKYDFNQIRIWLLQTQHRGHALSSRPSKKPALNICLRVAVRGAIDPGSLSLMVSDETVKLSLP